MTIPLLKEADGSEWWTRDKSDWKFSDFVYVKNDGQSGYQHFKCGYGVAPGFSI